MRLSNAYFTSITGFEENLMKKPEQIIKHPKPNKQKIVTFFGDSTLGEFRGS